MLARHIIFHNRNINDVKWLVVSLLGFCFDTILLEDFILLGGVFIFLFVDSLLLGILFIRPVDL